MKNKSFSMKKFLERYERHLSSGALLFGFIVDSLTLRRIDQLFENIILFSYLLIAGIGSVILSRYEGKTIKGAWHRRFHWFLLLVMQFAFGGLFSAFFIFYSRSATLGTSWPFMIMLLVLLVGNEFLKKQYQLLTFRISVFFVALFSFFIFYVPVLAHKIGDSMFILSGVVSLLAIWIVIKIIRHLSAETFLKSAWSLRISIVSIFLVINVLYFFNIIPPIPLALKEGVILQDLRKNQNGDYETIREETPWYFFWQHYPVLHVDTDGTLYAYSAVFAPTSLRTDVVHQWQYWDPEIEKWKTTHRVTFPIIGGNTRGYRGFSMKNDVFPGLWRVNILTPRGQLIGRLGFSVENEPSRTLVREVR